MGELVLFFFLFIASQCSSWQSKHQMFRKPVLMIERWNFNRVETNGRKIIVPFIESRAAFLAKSRPSDFD